MGEVFGRTTMKLLAGVVGVSMVTCTVMAQTQTDPPGRVGRLAFVDGTVSFHDDEENGWTRAIVNTPLTTGDALWTEPNARSEVSLAGTRIRMDGSTELDMTQIDDRQVRLQLAQGRLDVKSTQLDTSQPYEIVTPRGTISLQQQGDYYVEAGSQQDPTRLGVRAGAAQIQGLNGQTLAVRPGEVGEVYGDGSSMQLKTVRAAPPAPAASWAARDRQVVYEQPPQYLPAGITGYEDLNAYGNWVNDGSYGQVWVPRSTPAGWAPYRTGHWSYVKPWGWTWIDEQPWGFAPYHYGRWANSNNRWVWVPPQREERPVYAPALVAFVGGQELAAQLGNQGRNTGPVGWFPLGPREAYVPPYSTDRDYYQRINRAARVQDRDLQERWERAQRREAFIAGQNSVLANQRFATVVPSQAFVRSQPVQRAVLNFAPDMLAKAAVAPVSAPPAPTASVASAAGSKAGKPEDADPKRAGNAKAAAPDAAVAKTAAGEMPMLAKPQAAERKAAPGPKIASTDSKAGSDAKRAQDDTKAAPALRPRQGAAPPALKEDRSDKPESDQAKQTPPNQEPGKPATNQPREAAPAPRKPELASPAPVPANRDEQRQPAGKPDAQKSNEPRQEDRKQAAPEPPKPNAAPQSRSEEPKQAAPAPEQRPAAIPQPRKDEEPRQAAPQPTPKPEAAPRQEAPRQEAPRQAAPQPRADPQQPPPQQAQPPRPQPQQQQAPQPQRQQQPQPQQQVPRDRETRAPAPQQQQQIAQPPKSEQPQKQAQPQQGNGKKDKD